MTLARWCSRSRKACTDTAHSPTTSTSVRPGLLRPSLLFPQAWCCTAWSAWISTSSSFSCAAACAFASATPPSWHRSFKEDGTKTKINFLSNVNLLYVCAYVLGSHVEVRNNLHELMFSFHHVGLGVRPTGPQPSQMHPFTRFDGNSLTSFKALVSPRYTNIKSFVLQQGSWGSAPLQYILILNKGKRLRPWLLFRVGYSALVLGDSTCPGVSLMGFESRLVALTMLRP